MEKILEEIKYYLEELNNALVIADGVEKNIYNNLIIFVLCLQEQIIQDIQEKKEMLLISKKDADYLYRILSRNRDIIDLRSQNILTQVLQALKGER